MIVAVRTLSSTSHSGGTSPSDPPHFGTHRIERVLHVTSEEAAKAQVASPQVTGSQVRCELGLQLPVVVLVSGRNYSPRSVGRDLSELLVEGFVDPLVTELQATLTVLVFLDMSNSGRNTFGWELGRKCFAAQKPPPSSFFISTLCSIRFLTASVSRFALAARSGPMTPIFSAALMTSVGSSLRCHAVGSRGGFW